MDNCKPLIVSGFGKYAATLRELKAESDVNLLISLRRLCRFQRLATSQAIGGLNPSERTSNFQP